MVGLWLVHSYLAFFRQWRVDCESMVGPWVVHGGSTVGSWWVYSGSMVGPWWDRDTLLDFFVVHHGILHGLPWHTMVRHGTLWTSTKYHGASWQCYGGDMDIHGNAMGVSRHIISWHEKQALPWYWSMALPWNGVMAISWCHGTANGNFMVLLWHALALPSTIYRGITKEYAGCRHGIGAMV